jgi:hypothetical protein
MKLNEEQLKLGLRNNLVAVNLNLHAAKTHRRLSLYDSLPDILVLTDQKGRKEGGKEKPSACLWRRRDVLPRIKSQRGTTTRRLGPNRSVPSGGGPGRSRACGSDSIEAIAH